jgi:hypothetical protein
MSLFVDGMFIHGQEDGTLPYRSGYHGFRTWASDVRYSDFKVYSIIPVRGSVGSDTATQERP